ncbi:MAG: NADH-quinone oxidoreductase subunit N, partial [Arcobacteraceae bacterium]
AHAGFVMAAILVGTTQSTEGLFLYWILFSIANFGAFTMLWIHRSKNSYGYQTDHPFEKYSGLVQSSPILATIMGIFLLSLAGIPPFSLFWGKMFLLSATINAGYIILAVIMALNSAIAVYYYLKLIVYMFLKDPIIDGKIVIMKNANRTFFTLIGLTVFLTLTSVLYIDPLLDIISTYVQISGY